MSWDIFVQDFPDGARSLDEIPDDFTPASIGKRSAIVEQIKAVAPNANFSNPTWGTIEGEDWSIEVNIGPEEDCRNFAFHVRGEDAAVGVIATILQRLNLRAVDSESGGFFAAGPEAIEAFRRWRSYSDQVTNC
jgi:hypothetical protein